MASESSWLWFANAGGPLIVLPREATSYWEGGEPPSGGRVIEASFLYTCDVATDYDRACDVEDLAGTLDVGPSWGLVLGDDVPSAGWMRSTRDDSFFIVRILYANDGSDAQILEQYHSRREADWKNVALGLSSEHGDLFLMHAAGIVNEYLKVMNAHDDGFAVIGDAIVYQAQPGTYKLDVCEVEIHDEAHFTFYRFTRS